MSKQCPKCGQSISYHYEDCKRHDLEKNHIKCIACGAYFDVEKLCLVAPITVYGVGINYARNYGIRIKQSDQDLQELLTVAF